MSDTILALDSSGTGCVVGLLWRGEIVASETAEISKGQAEVMPQMVEHCFANHPRKQIDRIAVGIGPGNFTGTRVAVALARGLALSLGRPAIGISNFELQFAPADAPAAHHTRVLPGPKGTGLAQDFERLTPTSAPYQMGSDENARAPSDILHRLFAYAAFKPIGARPAPLYVRPPDAALPATPPPRHL